MLEKIKTYQTFPAGSPLIHAGDDVELLSSLVEGCATISMTLEDGRVQMVGLLLPSDFIGRPGRQVAPYDITAISEVTLCSFRRRPFEVLIAETPHIGQRLLEMTLDELDAAREWMVLLGRKTAREKIASLMVILSKRLSPRGHDVHFELPLTREAMASYLGLTLETVSRQITALRRDGVIVQEGRRGITVPDLDRLIALTGDDTDGGLLA
ncbi:CRP/FNR family transcriptional regulator, anaerobic regulatory protein [Monaibacterium marinum]|uniref:CRP/FNR family transcriptional regulator, anaerobic regulatory protein n=2 Tax=Pontivivens marinum TaxID=1690039 RepID=A0A2C9CR48_9RHOB|nr:Crp/Fnr family transcriptional regulator [Monaibacterium marinum]SOH93836.1 CRP/FNR family transcriptional regulator, anaerobic regulatory protein [Monaibacterium marinum]